MGGLYNILTDTEPPRARPGPSRPSSSSGGPPAAARCGGVTNPTTEHRDAVGRSEAQLGVCIAHPGLSPGPINRRLRRRGQELLFTAAQTLVRHSTKKSGGERSTHAPCAIGDSHLQRAGRGAAEPSTRRQHPKCAGTARCAAYREPTPPVLTVWAHCWTGRQTCRPRA